MQRIIHSILTLSTLAVISTIGALAQSAPSLEPPITSTDDTWQVAQGNFSSKGRLDVVTFDQPQHWHSCRVESFTPDSLVCSRAFGGSRTYLRQQVLALILPGENYLKLRLVLGFNVGVGTAIWGAVVLAATCPACAAVVSVAALALFGAAGAVLIGDDQPDRLAYLAPGQKLTGRLRFIQP